MEGNGSCEPVNIGDANEEVSFVPIAQEAENLLRIKKTEIPAYSPIGPLASDIAESGSRLGN